MVMLTQSCTELWMLLSRMDHALATTTYWNKSVTSKVLSISGWSSNIVVTVSLFSNVVSAVVSPWSVFEQLRATVDADVTAVTPKQLHNSRLTDWRSYLLSSDGADDQPTRCLMHQTPVCLSCLQSQHRGHNCRPRSDITPKIRK